MQGPWRVDGGSSNMTVMRRFRSRGICADSGCDHLVLQQLLILLSSSLFGLWRHHLLLDILTDVKDLWQEEDYKG